VKYEQALVSEFHLTDSGNADYFERETDGTVAFDHTAKCWYEFDGHHWRRDTLQRVHERCVEAMRARQHEALMLADPDARKAALRFALQSEERRRVMDCLALAQSRRSIAVDASTWDRDPMLFAVQNGVIDLARGALRPGMRQDRITTVSPVVYDPEARAPRFEQFLGELFRADSSSIAEYLKRVLGYCLTGLTSEQAFWVWWGSGSNGKSTLIALLRSILGPYSWTMPFPVASWTDALSDYQKAELPGRRLVAASEVRGRAPLHEDLLKSLSGGDEVNARRAYGHPFTFTPVCKVVLICNERPVVRDTTHSMWRRLRLVPFLETFAPDEALADELAGEAAGILNVLVQGCRDWQREGFKTPESVHAATAQYREESDPLADFIAEQCLVNPSLTHQQAWPLWLAYERWCHQRHLTADDRLSQRKFGEHMKAKFPPDKPDARRIVYRGIALRTDEADEVDA